MPNASMILSDPAIPKLDKLPDGWKRTVGAQTAPIGWYWANRFTYETGTTWRYCPACGAKVVEEES